MENIIHQRKLKKFSFKWDLSKPLIVFLLSLEQAILSIIFLPTFRKTAYTQSPNYSEQGQREGVNLSTTGAYSMPPYIRIEEGSFIPM